MTSNCARKFVCGAALGTLLALAPAVVAAKDLCIQNNIFGGGAPIVGKGFTLPGKGKCKPFVGFIGSSGATGSACTSTSGNVTHFTIYDNAVEVVWFDLILPLPSTTYNFAEVCTADTGFGGSCNSIGITLNVDYCPSTVTIPE